MASLTARRAGFAGLIMPPGAFRLLLAVAVVASHISRFDIGRLAVLLFFYLSGYWVSKVWVEKFESRAVGRFYAARYLRIAPLYLLVMLAAAWALGKHIGPLNLSLLGLASSDQDPLGVAWSLDIELQFYLLLPFLMMAVIRWPIWTAGGVGVLAALAWILAARVPVVTVAQYLPTFVLGMLTFTKAWRPTERQAQLSLGVFVIATVAASFTSFIDKRAPDPFDRDIFAFFWMLPLIPYVARSLHIRAGRLDRHLGNLSFPLYLVHYPLIDGFALAFGQSSQVRLLAVASAVAVAVALYLVIDRNLDRWRVRITESGLRT